MFLKQQCKMTTFEQFRKSSHISKSQSRISRQSQNSEIVNLHFSINQIIFFYDEEAQTLSNSDLSITNFSTQSIYFRILSNSAQNYEINPSQDIIQPSACRKIKFKLKKTKMALMPSDHYPNGASKIKDLSKDHLFQVQWALVSDEDLRHNKLPPLQHKQVLKVKVLEPYSTEGKAMKSKVNQPSFNFSRQVEDINFSQKDQSRLSVSKAQNAYPSQPRKQFSLDTEHNLSQARQSILTIPIISLVAIVSFILGFISA